ncbi:MAG: hypothetical protein B6242_14930 [Anaerolineaceae bacterium 4572_78]|nr:MAG: hypothetical protein B6242_14930 [Anaerolineaceae bacterium 4572_78]
MRYLNKIIFIQSAHINYTEIRLDGNVHFIGDQGVGKSTVLRAVLFFYNADTQKLGISTASNKDQFQEYYFKHTNSHIIYEVVSNEAKFLVWLYKEHGRLCYRFIESPYEQSFFMTEATKGYQSLTPDNVIKRIRSESYCYLNTICTIIFLKQLVIFFSMLNYNQVPSKQLLLIP